MIAFEHLYEELEFKAENIKLYKLFKVRNRGACNLDQVKCINDENNKVFVKKSNTLDRDDIHIFICS